MTREHVPWNPDLARMWGRVVRDIALTFVGTFMLLWQTVSAVVFGVTPNALIVGAGLVALGLPPAFRMDKRDSSTEGDQT